MSEAVETAQPDTPALEAREVMKRQNIRHLIITRGKVVEGVVSSHDLDGPARAFEGHTVAEYMAQEPITASPKMTVKDAANLLRGRRIGCLPIVEKGKVVGVVTTSDLLELVGKGVSRGERPYINPRNLAVRRRGPTSFATR